MRGGSHDCQLTREKTGQGAILLGVTANAAPEGNRAGSIRFTLAESRKSEKCRHNPGCFLAAYKKEKN